MNTTVGYTVIKEPLRKYAIPLFIFCIYITGVNIGITQWIAKNFSYHSSLGSMFFDGYYLPWMWISWTKLYSSAYPSFFQKVFMVGVLGFLGAVFLAMVMMVRARKVTKGNLSLHGTAHFASKDEVESSGLQNRDVGVYVGAYQENMFGKKIYLRHNGKEHIFCFAPTRSGKGVGLILPTLLSWTESAFILDIKGENFALTAGWRQKHANNSIIKFQPNCNDGTGSCFNPFEEVRLGTDWEYMDVDNIINIIAAPEDPKTRIDPHFDPLAKSFLVAVALHYMHEYAFHGEHLTLPALNMEVSNDMVDEYLAEMVDNAHTDAIVNVAKAMRERRKNSPKEAGGVISTAQRYLRLYNDPIVAKNMRKSDFKITDLMRADKPVSLYLCIPPNQIGRFAPLTRMIIDTIIQRLASEMEFAGGEQKINYKHRLLLMLDEFPAFGYIPTFEAALSFIATYGIKAYIIAQDRIQLKKSYTQDQTITTNCQVHIAYPPNEKDTAKYISEMTGETTIIKKKITTSGKRTSFYTPNMTITNEELKRPLLYPDEVTRMKAPTKDINDKITKAGEMLIFQTGHAPIRGKQILFWETPEFLARSKVQAPERGDIIKWENQTEN